MIDFDYTVKRSDRRSISVRICDDNSILVRCPRRTSEAQIERFLASKEGWIRRNLLKNAAENATLSDIISYKAVLICGKAVPLRQGADDNFTDTEICVRDISHLKKLLIKNLSPRFLEMFGEIEHRTGLKCSRVGFRDYKSRWGCCNTRREIVFNYKLLMLSEKIQEYVAAHELCHTVHMDHSEKFYRLLEKLMPDYKSAQRELKKYSRITRLY